MNRSQVACVTLYPLAIPLRKPFKHAAKVRETADPLVVEVELADGTLGYGETLPRPYVSGETVESAVAAVAETLVPELLTVRPESFAEVLERIDALPDKDEEGRIIAAARCGLELALLDAYSQHFKRPLSEAVGWLGLPGFGPPGSLGQVTYSGVLSADEPSRLRKSLRKMRWFGLRDFKLKVGFEGDVERVRAVADYLGKGLQGKLSLRLDANGGWTLAQAIERLTLVKDEVIQCVEQPLPKEFDHQLPDLKKAVATALLHDESLVTMADAERLHQLGVADVFNIRISKNGGFLAALRLAGFARRRGIRYQLGCMVGETSILSAVGRRFIEYVPNILFAEGSYGRFLITGDVADPPVQFGCGGKCTTLSGLGWGLDVERSQLTKFAPAGPVRLPL